jgi:hypothetical protein
MGLFLIVLAYESMELFEQYLLVSVNIDRPSS